MTKTRGKGCDCDWGWGFELALALELPQAVNRATNTDFCLYVIQITQTLII